MKRALVLPAVVCVFATACSASSLNVWLSANPTTTGYYPVQIWAQIVPDPGEDIANNGLCSIGVTVYTPSTVGVTVPRVSTSVVTTWGPVISGWDMKIKPLSVDFDGDGDMDANEMCAGDAGGADLNIGVGAPVLLGTETWKMVSWNSAYLTAYVNGGLHWSDTIDPVSGALGNDAFVSVGGTAIPVGPAPGPTSPTIAMTGPAGLVNTSTRAGKTTDGRFATTLVSGHQPTGGTLTFGDGASQALAVPLPDFEIHTYSLGASETSHTFTYGAVANNGAGPSNTLSGSFTLVESPTIVVLVNGEQISPGEVVSIPGHNQITIDMSQSRGYISNYTTILCGYYGVQGPVWTGDVSGIYGTVTCRVKNSGTTGLSQDLLSFTIIPEPASVTLLLFGAVAVLRRRRQACPTCPWPGCPGGTCAGSGG